MQYILYFKRSLILCFFALFIQQTAFAGANLDLLDILKNNGSISEEQYKQLLQTDDATLTDAEEPSYYLDNSRGLEVTSMDGENYINIGAFIGLDAAFYHSEDNQFGDGTEIRHARLSLSGMQNGIWAYDFSLDVSDPAIKVKDAYIENKDSFLWTWRVGQFKQPFSLESLISIKNSLFMERSLMNELTLGRSQGLGLKYQSIDWNMTVGLFGDDYNSDTEDEGDEGWSATTRLVYAPKTAGEHFFHTALAVSKQSTNDENEVRFRTRPESHLTDLKLFDTGKIKDTTLLNRTGLEFAWVKGAWSTQLEWIELSLTREDKDDLVFTGWYSKFI